MKKRLGYFLLALFLGYSPLADSQNAEHLEGCIYTSGFDTWTFYRGYKDKKTGKVIIPPIYDEFGNFEEGLAYVSIDDKFGFINMKGQVIIPLKFDFAGSFSEGLAVVNKDGKKGFVNKTGAMAIPFKYEDAGRFSQGRAWVRIDGKVGFINKTGQLVIPARYDEAEAFKHGVSVVRLDGKYGVIDKTGNEVIPFGDYKISYFNETLFVISSHNKSGLMDRKGNWVLPMEYSSIRNFDDFWMSDNIVCQISKDGLTGYVDRNGQVVVEPRFADVRYLKHPGIVKVAQKSVNGEIKYALFRDTDCKVLNDFIYDEIADFNEGTAAFLRDNLIGIMDTNGVELVPPVYTYATSFQNGFSIVSDDQGMAVINRKNEIVTEHYDFVLELSFGCFGVNNGGALDKDNNIIGGRYGVLDRNLNPMTEVVFDDMIDFNESGVLFMVLIGQLVMLDTTGYIKELPNVKDITDYYEGMAAVLWDPSPNHDSNIDSLKWGFLNTKGELVIEAVYDDIRPFGDGVAFVLKGEQWFLINKTGKVLINMDDYHYFREFSNKRAMVQKKDDEKWGFIDTTGKLIIPCIYSDVGSFKEGQAEVLTDSERLIINTTGQTLRKFKDTWL